LKFYKNISAIYATFGKEATRENKVWMGGNYKQYNLDKSGEDGNWAEETQDMVQWWAFAMMMMMSNSRVR
jgi:hypothetical protein